MASPQIALIRREIEQHTNDVLAEGIGKAIGQLMRETHAKIVALEARISEFKFVGAWSEGKTYKAGNFCSMGGALYHCNVDTTTRPGSDMLWSLAVPKPRDGRDGAEPRTVRTGERSLAAARTVRDNR